jgi:hypothetical protein
VQKNASRYPHRASAIAADATDTGLPAARRGDSQPRANPVLLKSYAGVIAPHAEAAVIRLDAPIRLSNLAVGHPAQLSAEPATGYLGLTDDAKATFPDLAQFPVAVPINSLFRCVRNSRL